VVHLLERGAALEVRFDVGRSAEGDRLQKGRPSERPRICSSVEEESHGVESTERETTSRADSP